MNYGMILFRRQVDSKGAALPERAFNCDFPAVNHGNVFHNRQAQTCSSQLATAAFIDNVKSLEYPLLIFFSHAAPVVLY